MAMFDLNIEKDDAPRRSVDGQRGICWPSTTFDPETPVRLSSCDDCGKEASHNIATNIEVEIPHGEARHDRVAANQRYDVATFDKVQSALFHLAWVLHGYIGDEVILNVGNTANNASQKIRYEVKAVNGAILTLEGPNPKRIEIGRSVENPEWFPGSDEPRLIAVPFTFALPYGCRVEPVAPSVLAGKKRFLLSSWQLPSSDDEIVEFNATVVGDASNIIAPFDLAQPPTDGKYYVDLRAEILYPQKWLNLQAPIETQFAKRVVQLTTMPTWPLRLKDSDGGDTRILYPGMRPNAFRATYIKGGDAVVVAVTTAHLTTTQSGGAWTTDLDLTGLVPADADELTLEYWHEALAANTPRQPFAGSCAHSQSHPHISNQRICMARDCSQRETHEEECWQPDASRFALGEKGAPSYGAPMGAFPDRVDDALFWSSLWHRVSWVLNQRYPLPEFELERPAGAGPSIAELLGGWLDEVPGGLFAERAPWHQPVLGRRYTWQEDSNQYHGLVYGAWYSRAFDFDSTGGPSYAYDGDNLLAGTLPWLMGSGWSAGKDGFEYPWRFTGRTNVYTYSHGGSSMGNVVAVIDNAEKFVTNLRTADEIDGALEAIVRGVVDED